MRIFALISLCTFSLLFISCSQQIDYSEFEGAWKSEKMNPLTQQPRTIIINKDSVNLSGETIEAEFRYKSNTKKHVILVSHLSAPEGEHWFTIIPSGKNKIEVSGFVGGGDEMYVRTTPADVEHIRNSPRPKKNDEPIEYWKR